MLWDADTHGLVQDGATETNTSMFFTVVCFINSTRVFDYFSAISVAGSAYENAWNFMALTLQDSDLRL